MAVLGLRVGFSLVGADGSYSLAPSLVAEHGLKSTRASVVVALRLSCSAACGILVPRPRLEPTSPALQGGFLITGLLGKSSEAIILTKNSW